MLLQIIFKDFLYVWVNFKKSSEHWHTKYITHINISILIVHLLWIDGICSTNLDE